MREEREEGDDEDEDIIKRRTAGGKGVFLLTGARGCRGKVRAAVLTLSSLARKTSSFFFIYLFIFS